MERVLDLYKDYLTIELAKLHKKQMQYYQYCVADVTKDNNETDPKMKVYGKGTVGYILTEEGKKNNTCIYKTIPETTMVSLIRIKQQRGDAILNNDQGLPVFD